MTTDHTPRPVIDELRAAERPPGEHVHFPEVAWPEPAAAPTAARIEPTWAPGGIPDWPPSYAVSGPHLDALQRACEQAAAECDQLLPIGMIEPVDDAAAVARALGIEPPRRPSLVPRIIPTTATAFWMAVSGWLTFLLARVEGWL